MCFLSITWLCSAQHCEFGTTVRSLSLPCLPLWSSPCCLRLFSHSPVQLDTLRSLKSFSRHLYLRPPPSILHPPSALISSLLLSLQLKGLQLWPWIGITSHQADKYQNVNDSRVEAGEVRCAGIEHPMSRASRGTTSNWSGEKTAEVPGRPMVDDLTAPSSPGCGWLGYQQHSQQPIHNGDNVWFYSSHSWWGFSYLFICSFPPCWKDWCVSVVLSMSRRPFHQISHAHLCFGFLMFYCTCKEFFFNLLLALSEHTHRNKMVNKCKHGRTFQVVSTYHTSYHVKFTLPIFSNTNMCL